MPCPLCQGEGKITDPEPGQVKCHWCNGNGFSNGCGLTLCNWCKGRGYRWPKIEGTAEDIGPIAFYVEAGKPRSAHLSLTALFEGLKGELRVCDPYYGRGSLLRLDCLVDKPIRFLTKQPDSKESAAGILSIAMAEFTREHPLIEFRRDLSNELHDRFILSSDEIVLLGHGLKDVGNKDSFVVRLGRAIAADMIDQVANSFDRKWAIAALLH